MSVKMPRRPDRIDHTLFMLRMDLDHSRPPDQRMIPVERRHLADLLSYIEWLEDQLESDQ